MIRAHCRPSTCPEARLSLERFLFEPTYRSRRTNGFNDLNGDGIPDYLAVGYQRPGRWQSARAWALRRPSRLIDGSQFELSLEKVGCYSDNASAGTAGGLYDFYGEGSPRSSSHPMCAQRFTV